MILQVADCIMQLFFFCDLHLLKPSAYIKAIGSSKPVAPQLEEATQLLCSPVLVESSIAGHSRVGSEEGS